MQKKLIFYVYVLGMIVLKDVKAIDNVEWSQIAFSAGIESFH